MTRKTLVKVKKKNTGLPNIIYIITSTLLKTVYFFVEYKPMLRKNCDTLVESILSIKTIRRLRSYTTEKTIIRKIPRKSVPITPKLARISTSI